MSRAVQASVELMSPVASAVFVQKVLKEDTLKKIGESKKKLEDYEIPGVDMLEFVRDAKENVTVRHCWSSSPRTGRDRWDFLARSQPYEL